MEKEREIERERGGQADTQSVLPVVLFVCVKLSRTTYVGPSIV